MNANIESSTNATPCEQLGGETGVGQLVKAFYDVMETSPGAAALCAMHAYDIGPPATDSVRILGGWLDGPRTYFERPNAKCMMSAHPGIQVSRSSAEQWLDCMRRASATEYHR
jgi:hemoglobin